MPFIKGQSGNPNGRKPRAIEERFLKKLAREVTIKDWVEIIDQAKALAKRGDTASRKWLSDYLIGVPIQRNEISGANGEPYPIVHTIEVVLPLEEPELDRLTSGDPLY